MKVPKYTGFMHLKEENVVSRIITLTWYSIPPKQTKTDLIYLILLFIRNSFCYFAYF